MWLKDIIPQENADTEAELPVHAYWFPASAWAKPQIHLNIEQDKAVVHKSCFAKTSAFSQYREGEKTVCDDPINHIKEEDRH